MHNITSYEKVRFYASDKFNTPSNVEITDLKLE